MSPKGSLNRPGQLIGNEECYLAGFCLLIMIGLFLSSRTHLLGVMAGDFEGILSVAAPPLLVEVAAGLEVLEPRGGSGGLRGLKIQ